MTWIDFLGTAASTATAVAIVLAALQLKQSANSRRSEFELRFSDRYEECVGRIDLAVLLDEKPYDPTDDASRRGFYDYFELCELECHSRSKKGVISDETWTDWCEGIHANAKKQSFKSAWADLADIREDQFSAFQDCFPGCMDGTAWRSLDTKATSSAGTHHG